MYILFRCNHWAFRSRCRRHSCSAWKTQSLWMSSRRLIRNMSLAVTTRKLPGGDTCPITRSTDRNIPGLRVGRGACGLAGTSGRWILRRASAVLRCFALRGIRTTSMCGKLTHLQPKRRRTPPAVVVEANPSSVNALYSTFHLVRATQPIQNGV